MGKTATWVHQLRSWYRREVLGRRWWLPWWLLRWRERHGYCWAHLVAFKIYRTDSADDGWSQVRSASGCVVNAGPEYGASCYCGFWDEVSRNAKVSA